MALYVIDAEIRESARSANHDVAHTRLQWWRQEIDRLANRNAQHPAARVLQGLEGVDPKQFSKLHELVVAADMDLARMTYLNMQEVRAYAARSGGAVQELIARALAADAFDASVQTVANRLGVGIREAEMLRDVRQDAHEGRLYLPLDELERHSLKLEDVRAAKAGAALRSVLKRFRESIDADLESSTRELTAVARERIRPLSVLGALHKRLLERIASHDYDVATQRIELGPIEKPWVAWRAARNGK